MNLVKLTIGRRFQVPTVKRNIRPSPLKVNEEGDPPWLAEDLFTLEIYAMVFVNSKQVAETELANIIVFAYFNYKQHKATKDADAIFGAGILERA